LLAIIPSLPYNALEYVDEEYNSSDSSGLSGLSKDCYLNMIYAVSVGDNEDEEKDENGEDKRRNDGNRNSESIITDIQSILGLSRKSAALIDHAAFGWAIRNGLKIVYCDEILIY
jgi:hypothetical protein